MTSSGMSLRAILLAGGVAAAWPMAAIAQDAAQAVAANAAPAPQSGSSFATNDADIVVTARARTERLIDVPVAATVLTSQALTRYSAVQIADVAKQVPQMDLNQTGAGGGVNLSLRGVGSSSVDAGVEQPVSLIIDGVGSSRGRLIFLGLFDVQAVEALKGPQALFFGKNSPAGVLSLTTTSPGDTFEGYVKTSYDFRDHARYLEGAVSIPLSETFAIRVAGRVLKSRGYLRNTAVSQPDPLTFAPDGSRVNTRPARKWEANESSQIGRITARWTPTDNFDATLKITGNHLRTGGGAATNTIIKCAPGATRPSIVIGPLTDPTGTCAVDYKVSIADLPLANMIPLSKSGRAFGDSKTYLGSLNMNYHMGDITFTSVTGYTNFKYANAGNFDYMSYAVLWGALRDSLKNFSQEFRATSDFDGALNFSAGALYEHSKRVFAQDIKVPGFVAVNGRYDNALSVDPTTGNTYSAYLQARLKIMPNLELAGGARYTREIKKGSLTNIYTSPATVGTSGAPYRAQGSPIFARVANNNVSPEATLTWHPTNQTTLYGAYKTGFLSGGISNPGNLQKSASAQTLMFRPVKVRGGEIGAKGSFLDAALTLTGAAYNYKYKDIQVISYEASTFSYTTKNAASARVKGIEATANYRATPELTLRGAASYNHSRYLDFRNGQCYAGQTVALGCINAVQDLSGTQLGATPDWSGNAGLTYDRPVSGDWRGAFSVDGYYRGSYNFSAAATYRPTSIQGRQVRVDASIRAYQADKGLEVAFLVRNLTKRITILYGTDTPAGAAGQLGGYLARPREAVLEATYRF